MSISFGFKKKIENKIVVAASKSTDPERLECLNVENKQFKSPVDIAKKEELIIPLIKRNRYLKKEKKLETTEKGDSTVSLNGVDRSVHDIAVKEILEESRNLNERENDGDEFDSLSVPLLLKNKVPEGFETEDTLDVSLRPNEATEADYDQIPIEAYGMAVLRGMGWSAEEGIGRTFKQNTKLLEQQVRPKGLGLGADVGPSRKKVEKRTEETTEDSKILEIAKNAFVFINKGLFKNKYGIVQSVDIETARCIVKLAIGGKMEQVSQHSLSVVSKQEYQKRAKYLGEIKKDYEKENTIKNGGRKHDSESNTKERKRGHSRSPKRDNNSREEVRSKSKSKHRKTEMNEDIFSKESSNRSSAGHSRKRDKNERSSSAPRSWVRPQMRVRIIDRSYRKGRFYLQKVIVEDVLGDGRCCCKTEDGKVLDDIHESMLETVIPRSNADAYVIIVRTSRKDEHNAKLAKILEKNKSDSRVLLQLIEDRDIVVDVGFDEVCEFTGDVEANAMF